MRQIILLAALFCADVYAQAAAPQLQESSTTAGNTEPRQDADNPLSISAETIIAVKNALEAIAANTAPDDDAKHIESQSREIDRGFVRQDLIAQKSMADSTWWIKWLSVVGVALSFAGIWMIGRTLKYTKDAANTTRETLREVRTNAKAELRPYITIEVISYRKEKSILGLLDSGSGEVISITFKIKNSGATPANYVEWGDDQEFTNNFLRVAAPVASLQERPRPVHKVGVIPANGECTQSTQVAIPKGGSDTLMEGFGLAETHTSLKSWFVVKFVDVFGRTITNYVFGWSYVIALLRGDYECGVETKLSFQISGDYPLNGEDIEEPK